MRGIYGFCILLFIITNVNSEDLKLRVKNLIEPAKKHNIISVKYDPFKNGNEVVMRALGEKEKESESTLHLTSILNKKAFINSKWYSVGDNVLGYKILEMNNDSVLTKKSNKIERFRIIRKDKLLKIRKKQ